jgi:hypothetical protein
MTDGPYLQVSRLTTYLQGAQRGRRLRWHSGACLSRNSLPFKAYISKVREREIISGIRQSRRTRPCGSSTSEGAYGCSLGAAYGCSPGPDGCRLGACDCSLGAYMRLQPSLCDCSLDACAVAARGAYVVAAWAHDTVAALAAHTVLPSTVDVRLKRCD